jgi:uncharacterized protein (DUF2141 family)
LLQEHAVAHIRLLPSIIKQTATLNISALKKSQANIVITDMAGRKIQNAVAVLNAGNNSVAMDFSALHSGAYLLTVFSDNVMPSTLRFIKQ